MANIPGTNVPAVIFGPNGFIGPSGPAVLAGVQADTNAAFGVTLNYQLTTPQGQWSSSTAALVVNANSIFVYYTQQVDPAFASGRMQDAIGRIYFMERIPSQSTVLQILCTGAQDVTIPVGATIQDTAGNLYACETASTFPPSGQMTVPFACSLPGPTAIPGSVSIYQAISGWDTAAVSSGVEGRDVETRAQFEARRRASVAKNSVGALPAIRGAVLAVPGVTDAYVTENDSSSPATIGGVTLVAKSIYVAATGGDATAIATAIWTKKAPGAAYNGNTTVTVYDQNSGYTPPFPSYAVQFTIPDDIEVLFAISIANSALVPPDAVTQIQDAIVAAFAGTDLVPRATIGSVIYASRYIAPVAALGSWASVISLQVGSNNTNGAVVEAHIAGTLMTVSRVVSGTVAVGQTVSGLGVTVGTTITALGTGSGGTGTYTISNTQTVAGATFTGTGSGTALTASAVTGTIAVGDTIAGTGVPNGTTIISQTSGTPGGAGVYETSGATTSSGAAITCGVRATMAVANQTFVSVQIDQQPIIDPANVVVTFV